MKNNEKVNPNLKIEKELPLQELLSLERTKLANERTFLSYLRTSMALLGGGLTIIRMDMFEKVYDIGWACLILSPFITALAIFRFLNNKRKLRKYSLNTIARIQAAKAGSTK